MRKLLLVALAVSSLGIIACGGPSANALVKRGISADERDFQAKNTHSLGLAPNLVDIYKDGYVSEGMTENMVHDLWGEPNRKTVDGTQWEYFGAQDKIMTTVKFDSTKSIRGEEHRIVTEILGDRYGGSPAPDSKR